MQASLGLIFILANFSLWLGVLAIQSLESSAGRLAPRSKTFFYFQDWRMATWGDLFGLSLLDFALGRALVGWWVDAFIIGLAAGMGLLGAAAFHYFCLMTPHRPDSGYPAQGRVSLHGRAHLVYLFLQASLCGLAFLFALEGTLAGWNLLLAVLGAIVYVSSYLADWGGGKLNPAS